MNKHMFWGCYSLFIAIYALAIDVVIQFVGLKYSISDPIMLFARTSICGLINMAILASPQFRHLNATLGKWFNRKLWALAAIPALFAVSIAGTSSTLSGMIQAQAHQIDSSREIMALCIKLAEQAAQAAQSTRKTAEAQRRIRHITKSGQTAQAVTQQLSLASQQLDCINEQQQHSGLIKQDEMAKIPLTLINALLPISKEINTEQFLTWFYISISFCLLMIGYFFAELGSAKFELAGAGEGRLDIKDLAIGGQLTDTDSQAAIDKKLKCGKKWSERDITRHWIADAHHVEFGKARKAETLDKFIAPTRKKLRRWCLRFS